MTSITIKHEIANEEEDRFHHRVHSLYHNILHRAGPPLPTPLRAIVRPSSSDTRISRFDDALHRTVLLINKRLGPSYMTLCYEGDRRWSMMGSTCAEWLEFEYVSAKHFKVTKLLRGSSSVICSFRNGGADMDSDIRNAFKILAQG